MASACHDLLCLVLQRIDRQPTGELDGVEVERFGRAALDALLENRVLVQRSPLEELDGCPVQWLGGRPFVFDPEGERLPEEVDPRLLTTYEVDLLAFCRVLRGTNQLTGPPVEGLSDLAYFVGHSGSGKRRRSLCLARMVRDDSVLDTVYLLRGHVTTGQLIVLTPTVVELRRATSRNITAINAVIVSIPKALASSTEPFMLSIPVELETEADAVASARLRLDTANQIATLDGREVNLTPREFDVLLAFANEAKESAGFVPRDHLFAIIEGYRRNLDGQSRNDGATAAPRDLENTVSRIRRALTEAAGLPSRDGRQIVQARHGAGYRLWLAALGLDSSEVAIF